MKTKIFADFQISISVPLKLYCNHDRGSEGLLHYLHSNNLGNTL